MNKRLALQVESLLAQMPNNAFLQSLSDRLRLGLDLSPKQMSALKDMSVRIKARTKKIESEKQRVALALGKSKDNDFLKSLLKQLEGGGSLTEKQLEALGKHEVYALKRERMSEVRSASVKGVMKKMLGGLIRAESRQVEKDFLMKVLGLVEGDLKITEKQNRFVRSLFLQHVEAVRGKEDKKVFLGKVSKHFGGGVGKRASMERHWDYEHGGWAYRIAGELVTNLNNKVMWGDPPKPNLWKARVIKTQKGEGILVESPMLDESLFFITGMGVSVELYQSWGGDHFQMFVTLLMPTSSDLKRYVLSHDCWEALKSLSRKLDRPLFKDLKLG